MGVEGHQPQHPRGFRALRLVFDTAALREDDFVNGLEDEKGSGQAALRSQSGRHKHDVATPPCLDATPLVQYSERAQCEYERRSDD